jgi:hypothetical protein
VRETHHTLKTKYNSIPVAAYFNIDIEKNNRGTMVRDQKASE